jgi:hypothetical protein
LPVEGGIPGRAETIRLLDEAGAAERR